MDPERWQRLKKLFASALEREPRERSIFLQEACGTDESLRAQLESLLAADQAHGDSGRWGSSSSPQVGTNGSASTDPMLGRRVGAYQIVQLLGRGGMAEVYLGVRADDQYRKRVAVKLIRQGLDNTDLLRRFRNERQTLAALDHPNIVKLLDGGSTADGVPYLIMDYVEGTPITEYCDNHSLRISERLQLFRKLCAAVHSAHQNLVIHRDLKPSNILVTADRVPKLLDFGIAKVLSPEAQMLVVTQTATRHMTPAYASPEQIRGEPLTNATDIYSLGVLLYELLTGHRPYRVKHPTQQELERAICEEEPKKPSTAVREMGRATADGTVATTISTNEISRRRGENLKQLRKRLSGDLDAMVMTALSKEPQRRYASVFALSEDVRRHLERLPVKARPSTIRYRCIKLLRRHNEAVLAAVTVLLLVGGVAFWQAHKDKVAVTSVGQQLNRGIVQPRRSIAVLGFKNLSAQQDAEWLSTALSEMLTTELGAGEKLRTVPEELIAQARINLALRYTDTLSAATLAKLRQNLRSDLIVVGSYIALADGRLRLDLRVQDAVGGEIVTETAEMGTEADLFDLMSRAGGDLREKLGIGGVTPAEAEAVRASLPSNPEATRLYAEGLAKLRVFDALAAKELFEQAITRDPNFALAHSALAETWSRLGYDARKRDEAKRAFELSNKVSREDQLWIEGHYREAASEWERASEIYRTLFTFAPDNIEYGLHLFGVQKNAGKPKDALSTLAALRGLPSPAGDDPRIDVAEAEAAEAVGDFKQEQTAAIKAFAKGQAQEARLLMAYALYCQAWALQNLDDWKNAVVAAEKARDIYAAAGDRGNEADILAAMATVFYKQGDLAGADERYEQALAISRQIGSGRGVASNLNNIAIVRVYQGNLTAAKQMWQQALAATAIWLTKTMKRRSCCTWQNCWPIWVTFVQPMKVSSRR